MTNKTRIELLQNWIRDYVNAFTFCPFSKPSWDKNKVEVRALDLEPDELPETLLTFAKELIASGDDQRNMLIALNDTFNEFHFFWQFVGLLEDFFENESIYEQIMIASFHPQYQFEGEPIKYSYTNRSPVPAIHFIQHSYISRAIEAFPEAKNWPDRNKKLIESKSSDYFKQKLNEIRHS